MFYRVQQFINAIVPNVEPSEITWALENLPAEAGSLFLKQSPPEQRHALDVAQSLMNDQNIFTHSDFHTLLAAALLHDCGKAKVHTRLWHRIFIVLMQKMPPAFWARLESSHTVFATPLVTATQHAIWGCNLAQKSGLNPLICLLIREHHNPTTELGRMLQSADNAN